MSEPATATESGHSSLWTGIEVGGWLVVTHVLGLLLLVVAVASSFTADAFGSVDRSTLATVAAGAAFVAGPAGLALRFRSLGWGLAALAYAALVVQRLSV